MSQNVWRKIGSKLVHANPWFSVLEDDVIRPDGKKGKYFVVTPKRDSVAVIPVDEDGGIYLVGQTRYPIGCKFDWEVIAGSIEAGDTPLEAAKKELEEEAGFIADEWQELGHFHTWAGVSSHKIYVFVAKGLSMTESKPEPTEDIIVRKVSVDDAKQLIIDHETTDGVALSALLKYLLFQRDKEI